MNIGDVRTIIEGDEIRFVAADVCKALDHSNTAMALKALDADEKGISNVYTLGGEQKMSVVTEAGLYRLIFMSRKPNAKEFQRWVFHEVIPSIRKRGAYMTPATTGRRATKKPRLQRSFLAICFKSRLPFCPARCIISVPTNIKAARRTVFMSV